MNWPGRLRCPYTFTGPQTYGTVRCERRRDHLGNHRAAIVQPTTVQWAHNLRTARKP